jgi:hypothetical protein
MFLILNRYQSEAFKLRPLYVKSHHQVVNFPPAFTVLTTENPFFSTYHQYSLLPIIKFRTGSLFFLRAFRQCSNGVFTYYHYATHSTICKYKKAHTVSKLPAFPSVLASFSGKVIFSYSALTKGNFFTGISLLHSLTRTTSSQISDSLKKMLMIHWSIKILSHGEKCVFDEFLDANFKYVYRISL